MPQRVAAEAATSAAPDRAAATRLRRPSATPATPSAVSAATPAAGTYAPSSHDPTLIGDVILNTRIMCRNRPGRPRSWISAATDVNPAAAAPVLAPAASRDDPPARPPRNR